MTLTEGAERRPALLHPELHAAIVLQRPVDRAREQNAERPTERGANLPAVHAPRLSVGERSPGPAEGDKRDHEEGSQLWRRAAGAPPGASGATGVAASVLEHSP